MSKNKLKHIIPNELNESISQTDLITTRFQAIELTEISIPENFCLSQIWEETQELYFNYPL